VMTFTDVLRLKAPARIAKSEEGCIGRRLSETKMARRHGGTVPYKGRLTGSVGRKGSDRTEWAGTKLKR